ncbi:MAG TPA: ROK family protein, partial [Dongiaceae bacterium]|nr:ROK family protein [Dongiaceae bacterium]
QGFVLGARELPKGRGLPPTFLNISPEGGYAIGVHVTPVGLKAALINLAGEVIGERQRALPQMRPNRAFREIGKLVAGLRRLRPRGRLLGIGLALPGPFDVDSMSFVGPTTLEGWKGVPVRDELAKLSGLPAFIECDLAAAALGERLYGAGRDLRDFYYLYFGVGLGGCLVHDGAPLRGAFGNAGEIGHLPLVPNGEACPCGNRGCLERYLSLEALERRSASIGFDGWIAEAAPLLRSALVTIENLFDPETIIIGGLAEEPVLTRLLAAAEPLGHSVAERRGRSAPRITRSGGGTNAVLRGAAALAVAGVLSPRFGSLFAQDEDGDPLAPPATGTEAA